MPLALASGAEVLALEVIESRAQVLGRASAAGWLPAGDGFLTDENAQGLVDVQHRAAEDHLQAIQRELERAGIERVACLVEEGQPGPVIVEVAERGGCDAIARARARLAAPPTGGATRRTRGRDAGDALTRARRSEGNDAARDDW